MKYFSLFIICIFVLNVKSRSVQDKYHLKVGIPKAKWLKEQERNSIVTKIVGGAQVSAASAYPYQAGLVITLTSGWPSVCGGSLISNTRVVTAAHCWWDGQNQARDFTVVLGSLQLFSGGTRITTTDVTPHPSWNTDTITFDIAMVRISSVQFNNNIQPIPLPSLQDVQTDFVGQSGVATGFGKISDSQSSIPTTTTLFHTTLKIISNNECQKNFEVVIHGSHLCTSGARGVGTCDGDSGGPLAVVWKNQRQLIGIVSFGLGDKCESGVPSVFTRVSAYLTWINANL